MGKQEPDWADEKALKLIRSLDGLLEDNIAAALRAEREESERRGAVRELRRDGGFRNWLNKAFTGTVFGESQYEKGMSAGLTVAVTLCDDYANELEQKPPQRGRSGDPVSS